MLGSPLLYLLGHEDHNVPNFPASTIGALGKHPVKGGVLLSKFSLDPKHESLTQSLDSPDSSCP